jgi:hypothetical protein
MEWYLRPSLKSAGILENRFRLFARTYRPGAQDLFWNIVQEVSSRVELNAVPGLSGSRNACSYRSGVVPPSSSGLAGLGDHGVNENKPLHWHPSADEWSGESSQ